MQFLSRPIFSDFWPPEVPPYTGDANQATFNKAFKRKMQCLSRPIFSDFWPPEEPPPAREVQIEQLFIKLLKETCNF